MSDRNKYEANAKTVEELLVLDSVAYMIPIYQRRYAWETQQVCQLIADLYDDRGWQEDDPHQSAYFLGSIVLAKAGGDVFPVLDGQQRLTTLSLLLAVLRSKIRKNDTDAASKLDKYLEFGRFGESSKPKIHLQNEDSEVYHRLIKDPSDSPDNLAKHTLCIATKKMISEVNRVIEQSERQGVKEILTKMVRRLLYFVEVVQIVAPDESRAFQLFESLNDRGLDLSAADLIKNKLFARSGTLIEGVRDCWQEMIENLKGHDLVAFLRYYWIAFHGEVRQDNLYAAYEKHIKDLSSTQVQAFTENVKRCSELYQALANPNSKNCPWGSETGERLRRLDAFRSRSCRPALLAASFWHRDLVSKLVEVCEAVTVRYSIVGDRNPNQLERIYGSVCEAFRKDSKVPFSTLTKLFQEVVPSDAEFREAFSKLEIGNITPTWRQILMRLNDAYSTGETRIEGPDKVHVEHILPKSPSEAALKESSVSAEDLESLVYRIGNLTLLSGKANKSISNGAFSKKQVVFQSSEIALNGYPGECTQWTKNEIAIRSDDFAKRAVILWPFPTSVLDS